jgi:hypothetical protein
MVVSDLPLLRRADLVRDQLSERPFGSHRRGDAPWPVRVGVVGTGEDLLVLAWSAAALAAERAAGVRLLHRLGVEPGLRVANTLPGALATPGSLLLGDVVEELGGLDVPLGEVTSTAAARAAWELIDRVTPHVLVADRVSAVTLFAAAPAAARPWWRGIVWLWSPAPRPAVPAAAGFAGWERAWLAAPEVTNFAAGSCPAEHFHLRDGVEAEVVSSALVLSAPGCDTRRVRYLTDVAARRVESCPCGDGAAFALGPAA